MIEIMEITAPISGEKKVLIQDERCPIILEIVAQRQLLRWFRDNRTEIWDEIIQENP
jgi:hypothetical protein